MAKVCLGFAGILALAIAIGIKIFQDTDGGLPGILKAVFTWECQGEYGKATAEDIVGDHSFAGKVAIVTGANTGLGKETARVMAKAGAHVIMACRSLKRCGDAKNDILTSAGILETMELDLNSLKSVKTFADSFLAKNLPLHYLVNNAGIMALPKWDVTADGIEKQWGVNHLGHFHLTTQLLDKLKASAPSRIVNLASQAHFLGSQYLPLTPATYDGTVAYGTSKVSNIMFSYELRRRLKGTGVVTAAGHPGIIATELGRYDSSSQMMYDHVWPFLDKYFGTTIEKNIPQGTSTTMCMLLHDLPDGSDDATFTDRLYFSDCLDASKFQKRMLKKFALNATAAADLWTTSEKLISKLT